MNEKFKPVSCEEFANILNVAKESHSRRWSWRILEYDTKYYEEIKARCYSTEGGSAVAVSQNGEIVTFCHNENDGNMHGYELIDFAKEIGGYRAKCFEGMDLFYKASGFEEVGRIEWDDHKVPKDWSPVFGKEDTVFFELPRENEREREIVFNTHQEKKTANSTTRCEPIEQIEQNTNYDINEEWVREYLLNLCDKSDDVKEFDKGLRQMTIEINNLGIRMEDIPLSSDLMDMVVEKRKELREEYVLKQNNDGLDGPTLPGE